MEVLGMFINLSAGDRLHIGESVTLTVLAVEGGLIHFGLESPGGREFCEAGLPAIGRIG
jgi:hypothetical protein